MSGGIQHKLMRRLVVFNTVGSILVALVRKLRYPPDSYVLYRGGSECIKRRNATFHCFQFDYVWCHFIAKGPIPLKKHGTN